MPVISTGLNYQLESTAIKDVNNQKTNVTQKEYLDRQTLINEQNLV